jgi:GntR family transcriptional repressor for pyruvate dehydrogenase complex
MEAALFTPIRKNGLNYPEKYYEKIIVSIQQMVLEGELHEGDKLPSERELAEQFCTSRVPVREALKILEFLGIVENIRGDGTYIKNIGIPELLSKIFFGFKIGKTAIAELFDIRLVLECYAVRVAAAQRTEEDLSNMKKSLDDMERDINSFNFPGQSSLDFHLAVVSSAKNSILTDIFSFLRSLLALSREHTLRSVDRLQVSLDYHSKVYEMIKMRDAVKAEHFMRDHLLDEQSRLAVDVGANGAG